MDKSFGLEWGHSGHGELNLDWNRPTLVWHVLLTWALLHRCFSSICVLTLLSGGSENQGKMATENSEETFKTLGGISYPACRWSHSGRGRRSPSFSGRAPWRWCQPPGCAGVARWEGACPRGKDKNTFLKERMRSNQVSHNVARHRQSDVYITSKCKPVLYFLVSWVTEPSLTSYLLDLPVVYDSLLELCWLAEWQLSLSWSWGYTPVTAEQSVSLGNIN